MMRSIYLRGAWARKKNAELRSIKDLVRLFLRLAQDVPVPAPEGATVVEVARIWREEVAFEATISSLGHARGEAMAKAAEWVRTTSGPCELQTVEGGRVRPRPRPLAAVLPPRGPPGPMDRRIHLRRFVEGGGPPRLG